MVRLDPQPLGSLITQGLPLLRHVPGSPCQDKDRGVYQVRGRRNTSVGSHPTHIGSQDVSGQKTEGEFFRAAVPSLTVTKVVSLLTLRNLK